MTNGLQDLYRLPPRDAYLTELAEQSSRLEAQLTELAETLPQAQRAIVEAYIDIRNELEFQSVKRAISFGKSCAGGNHTA